MVVVDSVFSVAIIVFVVVAARASPLPDGGHFIAVVVVIALVVVVLAVVFVVVFCIAVAIASCWSGCYGISCGWFCCYSNSTCSSSGSLLLLLAVWIVTVFVAVVLGVHCCWWFLVIFFFFSLSPSYEFVSIFVFFCFAVTLESSVVSFLILSYLKPVLSRFSSTIFASYSFLSDFFTIFHFLPYLIRFSSWFSIF